MCDASEVPMNGEVAAEVAAMVSVEVNQSQAANRFTNPANPFDVDGSGDVTTDDFQAIVNDLNEHGARRLFETPTANDSPRYVDVNRDGHVSPIDALFLVNWLNDFNKPDANGAAPDGLLSDHADPRSPAAFGSGSNNLPSEFVPGDEVVFDDASRFVFDSSATGHLNSADGSIQRFAAVVSLEDDRFFRNVDGTTSMVPLVLYAPAGKEEFGRYRTGVDQCCGLHYFLGIPTNEPGPFTNREHPYDIDNSGDVSTADVDSLIALLDIYGSRQLDDPDLVGMPGFVDVNADGFLTPLDVLQVTNYLKKLCVQTPLGTFADQEAQLSWGDANCPPSMQ